MESVVRLGTICELHEPLVDGALSFDLIEFAVLQDGQRLELHNDRGWSQQIDRRSTERGVDSWDYETIDSLTNSIRMVLLPDDSEPADDHDWHRLVQLFGELGYVTDRDHLRHLPYDIEFGPRLTRVLREHKKLPDGPDERVSTSVEWTTQS